ncbi:MAG: ABC transporter permease subunit [Planctomycetaceae bacterium]|nr:ABC transporter permease subunit [Planctomycetaceae bacterium]
MIMPFAAVPGWIQPLWMVPAGAGVALGVMVVGYLLLRVMQPKIAAIAQTTAHESLVQPLFWVELGLGVLLLLMFAIMPYVTFGDDVKMMKETSLPSVKVLAIILAIWSASVSVADEIEGRTALTLLSKPVTRWQFIVGKFFGVLTPVALLYILLGSLLLTSVSFKVVYEATIPMAPAAAVKQCTDEMLSLVPALFLSFIETVVLTSIAVALSTRLTMLSNLMISSAIYMVGHLVQTLVHSEGQNKIVTFVGQLLATILPVLDHFDVKAAVATGSAVPTEYLGWATCYAVIYSTIAILFALLLFEERDLG